MMPSRLAGFFIQISQGKIHAEIHEELVPTFY
jgi:hypothetical protein